MKIHKILNNNFVIVKDPNEKILMGLGIGYSKKVGDEVNDIDVKKTFSLSNNERFERFKSLIKDINIDIINATVEIIEFINKSLNEDVNEAIYISLLDHIASAIKRYNNGIVIPNKLLYDIQHFYKNEYSIALKSIHLINEKLNVELDEQEAGFITLYIINASIDTFGENDPISLKTTKIIHDVINIVRRFFGVELDPDSIYYYRFINHLKALSLRIFSSKKKNIYLDSKNYLPMLRLLIEQYPLAHKCSIKIKKYFLDEFNCTLGEEEISYLIIHVARIISKE